jgi:death-on-curing protein
MIILSKDQVLMLHERLIEATGGSTGIRDEGLFSFSALKRV